MLRGVDILKARGMGTEVEVRCGPHRPTDDPTMVSHDLQSVVTDSINCGAVFWVSRCRERYITGPYGRVHIFTTGVSAGCVLDPRELRAGLGPRQGKNTDVPLRG